MHPSLAKMTIRNLLLDDHVGYLEKDVYPDSEVKVLYWSSEYYSELTVMVLVEAQEFMAEYPGVFEPVPQLSHENIGYEVAIDSNISYHLDKYLNEEISRVFNGDIETDHLINARFKMMNNLPYELSRNRDGSTYFFSFEVEILPLLDRILDYSMEDFARAFTPLKEFYEVEVLTGKFFKRFMNSLNSDKNPKVSQIIINRIKNIPSVSTS